MKKPAGVVLTLLIAFLATTTLVLKIQTRALSFCQTSSATLISSDDHFTVTVSLQSVYQSAVPTLTFDMPQSLPARLNLVGSAFTIDLPDSLAKRPTTVMIDYVPVTQVNEADLVIAHYDTHANKWLPLPTAIDPVNHTAVTTIEHAGQYALVWLQAIRPLPNDAVIVDDQDEGFARYGHVLGWHSVSGSENHFYLGHMYWTSSTQTTLDNYAIWTPTLTSDPYKVYAFIDWDYATTERAHYQIVHNGQTTVYTLSQNDHYAEWVSLGVYNFGSDSASNYVRLEDVTGESDPDKQVGFDAIGFVLNRAYLPITLRGYSPPQPPKFHTGIHLGNRTADWSLEMLRPIDGDKGGAWPKAIVILSEQIWTIERSPTPPCEVISAHPRSDRPVAYEYLRRAAQNQVPVIIRIYPSPGNFKDWNQPLKNDHRLITDATPAGDDYCNLNHYQFRSIADVANEMGHIHASNSAYGWTEFGFEPANEPNTEWYSSHTSPTIDAPLAWDDMDVYFSALYTYAHEHYPDVKVFTPPMSQGAFAEGIEWSDQCGPRLLTDGTCGYDHMHFTYETHNDGYSWHNYWNQGRESLATCAEGGGHVFTAFPGWLQQIIINSTKPAHITESDLHSLCQGTGNPLNWKDDDPVATASSLLIFTNQGDWLVDFNAVWLLNDNTGYKKRPDECGGETDERYLREHDWHEAYDEDDRDPPEGQEFRLWFTTWWPQAP